MIIPPLFNIFVPGNTGLCNQFSFYVRAVAIFQTVNISHLVFIVFALKTSVYSSNKKAHSAGGATLNSHCTDHSPPLVAPMTNKLTVSLYHLVPLLVYIHKNVFFVL